ncbi:type VII secretion integral membrane protein EccD [Actinoallomurus iriomotensis]|uniref:EccD-like transmembrane domain-containing protein n=1 Tax=Actinoallomurus iriomotensis TaxID=478107 RepID=A0A9W6VNI2_9ACTN|nr:type VII secretion integral membrane protein EccD [Actinoallomurus iriomotensis]GLY73794.1 hypothetical protein Airi01_020610 [Actinoallomurus iriomotensis]
MSSAATGLCRLRFRAPESVFELAVPADVPLADLLPAIIRHAGPDLEEKGLDHGGWVLQTLGADPLDEERTAESLGLCDGEELHLRPRREALPPVHFDDLIDGIVEGMRENGGSWRPRATYRAAVTLTAVALAGGLAVLALPGPPRPRVLAAALTGALLLLGAASSSRAVGDARVGALLGAVAVPYAGLAGFLLPAGVPGPGLTGARLLASGSAAAGAAVLALAAVACSAPLFLAMVLVALLEVLAGVLALAGMPPVHAAAIIVVITVVFGGFVPGVAFRLSGMRLPMLPRNAEELQEDIAPFPAGEVIARSAVADAHLNALHIAVGAVCTAAGTLLGLSGGWAPRTMAAALGLLLVLHARTVGGVTQRLAMLVPGVVAGALFLARVAVGDTDRMVVLSVLLGGACALLVVAWTVPGRRLLPYWGRAGDLLHTFAALSLLPLALYVTGAFHALRAISG